MLKFARLSALALVGLLAAGAALADDKAAATVNGVAIPQSLVYARVKFAAGQGQPDTPDLRKMIRDDLINLQLLTQAAQKSGLDKQSDVAQQIELAKQSALAGAYVQDWIKNHPISEDAIKAEYDKLKAEHGLKEYKVSHILVTTEDEAKAIEAKLKKNAKFEEIAKKQSKDTGSAQRGGDLGWNAPSAFVAPFSEAMQKLKKGETSAPVQSQFGWHVIKLHDIRDWNAPPLEQVKPSLMQRMQQQAVQKLLADLRKDAKIE